ncbi:MAG TPA: hypothetical protein VM598_09930 [Bdellovibrionota bacterium]|nr:hypothetical protein [Bdellovibrionota bacterium]
MKSAPGRFARILCTLLIVATTVVSVQLTSQFALAAIQADEVSVCEPSPEDPDADCHGETEQSKKSGQLSLDEEIHVSKHETLAAPGSAYFRQLPFNLPPSSVSPSGSGRPPPRN